MIDSCALLRAFCLVLLCCPAPKADAASLPPRAAAPQRAAAALPEPVTHTLTTEENLPAAPKASLKDPMVPDTVGASAPPWRDKLDRIGTGRDALAVRLAEVQDRLRFILTAERPELLARMEKEAPKSAATGYGLLPVLVADEPDSTDSSPREKQYSMSELGEWVAREHGLVAELDSLLQYRLSTLERGVELFNKRAENFRNLDAHVAYHSFWQEQVSKWPSFWERKRELLSLYRSWRAPLEKEDGSLHAGKLREQLEKGMLRLDPSPALHIGRDPFGSLSLPVRIATDISNEPFLAAFAEGVERFWNGAQPMREAGLRIELTWERRSPESLYPEGAPGKGERIDAARHRKRFGSAPLVLTTGAESTHVLQGAIFLATGRMSRRALAHEFAHLLGFDDAYIRAYDGSGDGGDGVVFREVTPFPESLLASPGRGLVTRSMVETLLEVYDSEALERISK